MEIIHIVLGKANPERMNGVNKVVFQLATEQAKAGKEVAVWGITKELTHNYGERVFSTLLFQEKKNPFAIDKHLSESLKGKIGKAVFHIHGGWIPIFYSIAKLLSQHKIPFVFTPHGAYNSIAIKKSKWIKRLYFNIFEKQLLLRAAKIHCIGKSEVEGLKKIFRTDKTFLLPYGFDMNNSRTRKSENSGSLFTIGFVGRIDLYTKGLDLLINAFESLYQIDKNIRLWIVGDGDGKAELDKWVSTKNLQDFVTLWGSKFGSEKDELLLQFDLFVHPSRNEGLPSAVLEAASFGVPCLVTEATNVGDIVRAYNCGEVIENENVAALRDGLSKLKTQWEADKLKLLSANSIKMVAEAFNWEHIVKEYDKLYS